MNRNEQLAYLAGIIDGEGSISVEIQTPRENRKTDYYAIRLMIINTSTKLLDWVQHNFGGKIKTRQSFANRKQCYNWVLHSYDAANLLQECLPFMIIKKRHAEILIEFMALKKDTWFVSPEVQQKRRELYSEIKNLNKLGC